MSVEKSLNKFNAKYYIHSIIGLIIMFGFGFLPAFEPVTAYGMKMLGIFIGIVYLWSFVDMTWPSVAAFVAYALLSDTSIAALGASGFGNNQLLLTIFCLVNIYAILSHGVFDGLVPWMLQRKFIKGKPWVITIVFFATAFLLQLLQAQFAGMFLMFSIIYKTCESCKIPLNSKWTAFMIGGLIVTSIFGAFFYPFSGASIFVMGLFSQVYSMEYSYIQFSIFTISAYLIFMVIYILTMKFIIRIDVSELQNLDVANLAAKNKALDKNTKGLIGILFAFLIMLFLIGSLNLLPSNAFTQLLGKLGTTGISYIFFIIIAFYQINGKSALNLSTVGAQLPWPTIFILLVAFAVCPNLCTDDTGIPALIASVLDPILAGRSATAFIIILFTTSIILTNLANNTVVIFLIFSIFNIYAPQIDVNFVLCAVFLVMFSQIALLLPASSCFGAILYGEAEKLGKGNCFVVGFTTMIITIVLLLILIPYGSLIF